MDYTRGILPVALERGQIPTDKAIEMCRRCQAEEDSRHQADLLLAELASRDFSGEAAIYSVDSDSEDELPIQAPERSKPKPKSKSKNRGAFSLIKLSLFRSKPKS